MKDYNSVSRILIYPKDVILITGKTISSASRLLQRIKRDLKKQKRANVTIREFCDYTGLNEREVRAVID